MKRVLNPLSTGVGAVAGVLILIFYVAVEFEQIRQWKMWDPLRRGPDADVHVLIARLRNDPTGGYTEDVVEAVKETAMVYHRLTREWQDSKDREDAKQRRKDLLSETGASVLIEGYVGGAETSLRVWPRGEDVPAEHSFGRDGNGRSGLGPVVERAVVTGVTNEVGSEGAALMAEDTHTRMLNRARDVRRRIRDEKAKRDADFVIAYIAGVRADGPQGEQHAETAVRIYGQLLKHAKQPVRRLPLLTNLGINEFNLAKRRVDLAGAEKAMALWSEAEPLAEELVRVEDWVTLRSWQTEGDLFLHSVLGDSERIRAAVKRQVETVEDMLMLAADPARLRGFNFLHRVTQAWAKITGPVGCSTMPTRLITFRDVLAERECGGVGTIEWTREEYNHRRNRLERWTNAYREAERVYALEGFAAARSNLLRAQGLEWNDNGLLISSFAEQQEARTWGRIIDPGIDKTPIEIGIPSFYAFVDVEVNLALACVDRAYMQTLASQLADADLWCDRVAPNQCEVREAWRKDMVAALRYGLAVSEPTNGKRAPAPQLPSDSTSEVWERAKWVRDEGVILARSGNLCPNRPPGLGEDNSIRRNTATEKRVSQLREIPFVYRCHLPQREWTLAPSIYGTTGESGWHHATEEWLDANEARIAHDVQLTRACAGHP
ncbi:MAG: hypothetical protein OXU81_07295 [Gammaproteobacteria bacterium]|nr:hypothetical protein [Gammaproteobacteria bacterium]